MLLSKFIDILYYTYLLRGLSLQANFTDRFFIIGMQSVTLFCYIKHHVLYCNTVRKITTFNCDQ
jgi:hypothetical protein